MRKKEKNKAKQDIRFVKMANKLNKDGWEAFLIQITTSKTLIQVVKSSGMCMVFFRFVFQAVILKFFEESIHHSNW